MKKFYFLSTALLLCVVTCFSQAGMLDPSFGLGGRMNTNMRDDAKKGDGRIRAMAIQPDGKILAAGNTRVEGNNPPSVILRYYANGTPDSTFDDDGMVFCFGIIITSIAIQNDGKVVVAGSAAYPYYSASADFALQRYNTDGSPDYNFDGDGRLTTYISAYSVANCIAIQGDGKIIAAGRANNGNDDYALVRYNNDGSLDNSFDGDGKVITSFSANNEAISSIAIQNDGKIVATGSNNIVARYNVNGSLDNSFDGDGRIEPNFASNNSMTLTIQPDGRIIVGSTNWQAATSSDFILARYNTNGSPDNSFGLGGNLTTDLHPGTWSNDKLSNIIVQSDGKIIAVGYTRYQTGPNTFPEEVALARYHPDGSFDNSFDADGILTVNFGSACYPTSVALQSGNKIIVGGYASNSTGYDYAIACLNADGSPDNNFDGDGKLRTGFFMSYDVTSSMAVQSDGKIIVAGYTERNEVSTSKDFAIARYNPDGRLDNSFHGDGRVVMDIAGEDRLTAIAIQADGKIIAAGFYYTASIYPVVLVRYNANGTVDSSFDGDGKLILLNTFVSGSVSSVTIQNDGKIVLAGPGYLVRLLSSGIPDTGFDGDGKITTAVSGFVSMIVQNDGKIVIGGTYNGDFALARYNTNGSADNSFDGDGFVTTDINSSIDAMASIMIQGDGKIVAAGNSDTRFAVARYNTDGSLDNLFDDDGKLTTDMGGTNVIARSVAIQTNGKIIVAGDNTNNNNDRDFILARYNANGSPDNSLDNDGRISLDLWVRSSETLSGMKLYGGRIYLAGTAVMPGASDFILAAVLSGDQLASLPLRLLDFSGKLVNADALLNWKTENEVNTLEFIVERSIDGRNYTAIGSVASANSAGIHYYNFTDPNAKSLNTSILYYRLKQKDMDGRFTYSRIVALPLDKSRNIVLFYPNPVINEASMTITVNRPERVNAKIIDSKGRLVKQQYWSISAGSTSLSIDVQGLAKGMYYLELKGETISYIKQFVK